MNRICFLASASAALAACFAGETQEGDIGDTWIEKAELSTPQSLTGSPPSCSRIDLSWRAALDNVNGYRVYRTDPTAPASEQNSFHRLGGVLPASATSFSDTGLLASTRYAYLLFPLLPDGRVSIVNRQGVSVMTPACAEVNALPAECMSFTKKWACGAGISDYFTCGGVTYCDQEVDCNGSKGSTCTTGVCGSTVSAANYCAAQSLDQCLADGATFKTYPTKADCVGGECGWVCRTQNCGKATLCNQQFDCGVCAPGNVCGLNGYANLCGKSCVPDNAAACQGQGKVCGRVINNCGETISCGSCAAGTTCSAGACVTGTTCLSIGSRITVQRLSVAPETMNTSNDVTRIASAVIPQTASDAAAGGTVVGWRTGSGERVHISRIKTDGTRVGSDFVTDGRRVLGVLGFDDGVAVEVHRSVPIPPGSGLSTGDSINTTITRYRFDGSTALVKDVQRASDLANGQYGGPWNHPYGSFMWTGNNYVTWSGAGQYGHGGSVGIVSDTRGMRMAFPTWNVRCSHLTGDTRAAINGPFYGGVCIGDFFPPGINLWAYQKDIWRTSEAQFETDIHESDGWISAPTIINGQRVNLGGFQVGDYVPAPRGFFLAFTSMFNGGNQSDIGIAFVDAYRYYRDGVMGNYSDANSKPVPVVWLTKNTPESETWPHIVPFEEGYLAAWKVGAEYRVQKLDVNMASETFLRPAGNPEVLGTAGAGIPIEFRPREEFLAYPNGDVGWVWGTSSELRLARLKSCGR